MHTNTLQAPRAVGGGTIAVTTKNVYGYALAVTRRDRPERLLVCRYLSVDQDAEQLPPIARTLAESREQPVHLFAMSEHGEHGRWLATFAADGTTTT